MQYMKLLSSIFSARAPRDVELRQLSPAYEPHMLHDVELRVLFFSFDDVYFERACDVGRTDVCVVGEQTFFGFFSVLVSRHRSTNVCVRTCAS